MHHSNHFITTTAFDDYYFYAVRIIVFSQNEAAPRLDDETCDMGILFPILMTFIEADKIIFVLDEDKGRKVSFMQPA